MVEKKLDREKERAKTWEKIVAVHKQEVKNYVDRVNSLKEEKDIAEKAAEEKRVLLDSALAEIEVLKKNFEFSNSEQERLRRERTERALATAANAEEGTKAKYAARLENVCEYIDARDCFDQVALKLFYVRGACKCLGQLEEADFASLTEVSSSYLNDDITLLEEATALNVEKLGQDVLFSSPPRSSCSQDAPSQVLEGINEHGTNKSYNPPKNDKDELED